MNLLSGIEKKSFLHPTTMPLSSGISAKNIFLIMDKKIKLLSNLLPWSWRKVRFLDFWDPMGLAKPLLFLCSQGCTLRHQEKLGLAEGKLVTLPQIRWLEFAPNLTSSGVPWLLKSISDFTANSSKWIVKQLRQGLKNCWEKLTWWKKERILLDSCQEECREEYRLRVLFQEIPA